MVIQTKISEVCWCDPAKEYGYEKARLTIARKGRAQDVAWLDELFEGGIVLPQQDARDPQALCILIAGPPGSGKSTLALEMACRWGQNHKYTTAYAMTEAFAPWVVRNATSFGWKAGIVRNAPVRPREGGGVFLTDLRRVSRIVQSSVRHALLDLFNETAEDPATPERVADVLVVDSLNTMNEEARRDVYKKLKSLVSSGIKILLLIGDSPQEGVPTEPWEFAADVILRLGISDQGGYLVRTIEIVKARYQSHVWGKHQLKIYEAPKGGQATDHADRQLRLRNHPYITQGGIFVFPSIHYILSRYKKMSAGGKTAYLNSPLEELTGLLGKGFPKGHCTGMIGDRGAHKSHLSYLQVLAGLIEGEPGKNRVLIVSLRDDEHTTRGTLKQIVDQHWSRPDTTIGDLEARGDLEITYYPPGFITPEEFFHRLLLSINRLKQGDDCHVSVLFNSLDQLSSRFPLCAQHRIFIPGIIQMLTAEGITSYFVAAKDQEAGDDYYGLLSMAELILSFTGMPMERDDYLEYMRSLAQERNLPAGDPALAEWEKGLESPTSAVQLRVVRFAGGEPAGAHGILELFKDGSDVSRLFGRRGLVFIPSKKRVKVG